jgi:predicted ATPase
MVEKVTGGKVLPGEVVRQIVTKTDGVPLFVEELTKMVVESGLLREKDDHCELTGPLPPLAIPSTLQDSLMARLDRLSAVREIAQLGATLGREFSYELIHAVSPLDEETLQQGLRQLVDAELIYQRGLPPQAHYLFKHALVQETAYQSLLKSNRQQLHQQLAQVLEERFPETAANQPELLAHHYTEAGYYESAIGYWQRAGERALARSAHMEALSHIRKGLELCQTLPDMPKHPKQELALLMTLGSALIIGSGYTAPEVEQTYDRARALYPQVQDDPVFSRVPFAGLYVYYHGRGEFQTAVELGEQLLSLAQRQRDATLLLDAHAALGLTLFTVGELVRAQEHLEQDLTAHRLQQGPSVSYPPTIGTDPGVSCLSFAGPTLWMRVIRIGPGRGSVTRSAVPRSSRILSVLLLRCLGPLCCLSSGGRCN